MPINSTGEWVPEPRDETKRYMSDDRTSFLSRVEADEEGHPVGKPYSVGTYNNYKCRCPRCKNSASQYQKEWKKRKAERETGSLLDQNKRLRKQVELLQKQLEQSLQGKISVNSRSVDEILSQNTDEELIGLLEASETEIRNRDDLIELLWELCDE